MLKQLTPIGMSSAEPRNICRAVEQPANCPAVSKPSVLLAHSE
jgi:hypothetical protein